MAPKISTIYENHKRFYEQHEKSKHDRAWEYYNGLFYSKDVRDRRYSDDADVGSNSLSSKNLIYAIVDTALALLIGNSLGVAMNPRNQFAEEKRAAVEAYIDYVFSVNNLRRRSTTALLDAILTGRGAFKTTWDKEADMARTRVVPPGRLFFDMDVRDPDDISYWMEITVIDKRTFDERVAAGKYKCDRIDDVKASGYPKWMESTLESKERIRNAFQWVTLVEYYDVRSKKVKHWLPDIDQVVFEDSVPFVPYSLFSLSPNGRDCRGLSEVQLVLDDQEAINSMKSLLNQIAWLNIPKFMFDDGVLDAQTAGKMASAALGSWNPAGRGESETPGGGGPVNLNDLFAKIPTPDNPRPVLDAIERAEADASFVTAFASQQRGNITNVRTATEMAFVDAQLQTRTSNRRAMFYEAIEDVANKSLAYAKMYMRGKTTVKTIGVGEWVEIDRWIKKVETNWQTVAYNPLRDNPAVLGERLLQILPMIGQSPNIDLRRLEEYLLDSFHLPSYLLRPKEEVEAQVAEEAAAAAGAAGGEQMALPGMGAASAPAAGPTVPATGPGMPGIPPTLDQAGVSGGPTAPTVSPEELQLLLSAGDDRIADIALRLGAALGPEQLAMLQAQASGVSGGEPPLQ